MTLKYSMKCGLTLHLTHNDIEKIEYVHGKQPTESITSAYKRTGCDIIINANFYSMSDGATIGEVVDEGKVLASYGMSPYGYGFVNKKVPVFSYKNNANAIDFVGGYPCLLKDGKLNIDTKEYGFNATSTNKRGRTACGSNDDLFVIRVIPDTSAYPRRSIRQLADEMKSYGCKDAVNYDGGGSSQYISPWGRYVSGRPVDGFICVWLKKATPDKPTSKPQTSSPTSASNVATHIVKNGETLSGIARKYGTTYTKIAKDNNIKNPNIIRVGQVLKIIK